MLVLWYCFCVIGFDVHTCKSSDSQFVSTFVKGFTCHDIHPEHHCSHCEETDDAGSFGACESLTGHCCCSNFYHNLALTGIRTNQEQFNSEFSDITGGFPLYVEKPISFNSLYPSSHYGLFALPSGAVVYSERDVFSSFGIWRI